jgi:hypothetical protein
MQYIVVFLKKNVNNIVYTLFTLLVIWSLKERVNKTNT